MKSDERKAIHEAGHFVVSYHYGLEGLVSSIKTAPFIQETTGKGWHAKNWDKSNIDNAKKGAEEQLQAFYAGEEAERIAGYDMSSGGLFQQALNTNEIDHDPTSEFLSFLSKSSSTQEDKIVEKMRKKAKSLVDKYWEHVKAVKEGLRQSNHLFWWEAEAIVLAVDAGKDWKEALEERRRSSKETLDNCNENKN